MNSRNNGPVLLFETINIFFLLGIETVSCCLLQHMARMQMDQNFLQVLMLCLQNTPKNGDGYCSLMTFDTSIIMLQEHFVYGVKVDNRNISLAQN